MTYHFQPFVRQKSLFALLLSVFLCPLLSIASTQQPNVVILYADDMGIADVSYGESDALIQTPHIDRLVKQGMTFTDGHSSSGICTPSRFALLTGQHHWRRMHDIVQAFGSSVFQPDDFTIAKMFQKQGYNTGCFGKWHLGWDWGSIRKPGVKGPEISLAESYDWSKPFKGGPLEQGFDYYYGDGTINFPPYCWIENETFLTIPKVPVMKSSPLAGGGGFRKGPMAEDWNPYEVLPTMTKKTVEWIDKQSSDKPFFAYLAFNSPHYPIVPNKEFHGTSKAGYYGDFVVETDHMVGQVLDKLEEKGLLENTIVIFTADNGAEKHAFERLTQFKQWSSGPYRGLKQDIFEGGHRVPFIISWPQVIPAGSTSDEVVSQVDLAATFAKIIGYPLNNDEAIDSYNLLPVLKGENYPRPLRTATVQNTNRDAYALRQGDWVFMNSYKGTHRTEPTSYLQHFGLEQYSQEHKGLLFNLSEDPRQTRNLYNEHPERVKAMNALLNRYINGERCAPPRTQ